MNLLTIAIDSIDSIDSIQFEFDEWTLPSWPIVVIV